MIEFPGPWSWAIMLLIAAPLGALGGLTYELLHKGRRTGEHLGWIASPAVGAVTALIVLYFFPPQISTTISEGGASATSQTYDFVKMVALSLIAGSAGAAFLTAVQARTLAQMREQEVVRRTAEPDVQTIEVQTIEAKRDAPPVTEDIPRLEETSSNAISRFTRWALISIGASLVLLGVDVFEKWIFSEAVPKPTLLEYLGVWMLRGDLIVMAASLSIAVLYEGYFDRGAIPDRRKLYRNVFALLCLLALVGSVVSISKVSERYTEVMSQIYAEAYISAYEQAIVQKRRLLQQWTSSRRKRKQELRRMRNKRQRRPLAQCLGAKCRKSMVTSPST
jgi:hypothetical protein